MSIAWSFSYNTFVKFYGKTNWEPQHNSVISKMTSPLGVKLHHAIKSIKH